MYLEPRYHYKDLRVNLVTKDPLAGAIVVQFRTPKGTWNILAKVGYFNLALGAPKFYFSSQHLAFWLNQGALLGYAFKKLLLAFCSAQFTKEGPSLERWFAGLMADAWYAYWWGEVVPQAAAATAACAAALAKVKTVQVASFVAEAVRKALCEAIEAGRDAVLAKWSSMDLQMVPAVKEALALEPQWAAFRASFEGKLPLQQEHPEYDQLAQHLAKKFVKALKKF